ncbi:pilus assembly protein [Rhizobium sp. TH2]|uniref:TadE/TadG family type IV pilus assembly protein n=1 Tax=Rhizobium sp. TH2 TaxID=2775403 RepID=UPI002157D94E|nr:TadE/TadG family type IV pilus assembly protein [Rhizobium sp. TH2]UVC10642.1 pilus assembly protein [Rhizobium sp. TH2]
MMTRLKNAIVKSRVSFQQASTRLLRDRSGVSAIEFVLLFPILVTMMAGTVDIGQALTVSRKMNQIASTLGDMTSQQATWKAADIDAIVAGAATIIDPYSKTGVKIELAILDIDATLKAKVNWSRGYNTPALVKGVASPVPIPTNIAQSGVQLIAVRATYSLQTPFTKLLTPVTGVTSYNYEKTYIMRPRTGEAITLE